LNGPVLQARVLVVDDDRDFALALKELLDRNFSVVEWVDNEAAAIERLENGQYDLVILDIVLQNDPSGLRLCRRLGANERGRRPAIMMLSSADMQFGMSISSYVGDASCLPADDFVDKGKELQEVVVRARRIVERPSG
jgi:DNA-binding response OmpR family regulator